MSSREFEIVIVGSGPAGISTWLHLHDREPALAARSVVVEKATHPREKVCGGALAWTGDRQLRCLDLAIEVPAVAIHEALFRFGDERVTLPGDDLIRVVRRREFDQALVETARARGLVLHEDVTATGVSFQGDHAILRTNRGEYRARAVVGADGAQSMVRMRGGFGSGSGISRLIDVVTPPSTAELDEAARQRVVFDFGRTKDGLQGYVWHFPCLDEGRTAMNRGVFDSRVRPERPRADLRQIFIEELEAVGISPDAGLWRAHPVRPFDPDDTLARPHVVLVGDAAGIDPILGEGISQSIRHGDIAADSLVDAFERGDFSLASHAERFAAHELGRSLRLRHRLARDLYAPADGATARMRERFVEWMADGLP